MPVHPFQLELEFTETYRKHLQSPLAVREAMALRVLFPALFEDPQPGDLFAGRLNYRKVGFGLEQASGGPGYYCDADSIREQVNESGLPAAECQKVEEMIAFWEKESTIDGKLIASLPADVRHATENAIAHMGGRLAGACLDFGKLVRLGLPGLQAQVASYHAQAVELGREASMYDGFRIALDLLAETCRHYSARALSLAGQPATSPHWRAELMEMAAVLEKIIVTPPETLREAIQLSWLYALISGVVNYGRMDIYLGDYYANDIDSGCITEEEALKYLQSLWKLIADRQIWFNGRIIVGGMGRPNTANADRFAMAAMEATRTIIETEPQLSLRWHQSMNPSLFQKALDVLGEGRTYPIIYNDDVNVPAVANAFQVPLEDAEKYFPYGCGEYALEGVGFGSPNCSLNLLKAVEVTLHGGCDALTGEPLGLRCPPLNAYTTFEDLFQAYQRQVAFYVCYLADRHALEYEAERESAAFLFISMLFDGCIEKGRSVVDRGTRYQGGVVETFGIVNAADSLNAIRRLVFEERSVSPEELLAALDANFEGYERVLQLLNNVPRFGNDDPAADGMVQAVSDHISQITFEQASRVGLDYYLVVNINNYANVQLGKLCAASADGRRSGEPLANGNTPTAGSDRKGITAFLNSIARVDPSYHAGYTHNMKFSRAWFGADRPKLDALMRAYFARGGTQAMITVVRRGDLEAALAEPEKYRNLIVRVGGFSARFVDLAPDVQADLLKRTLY
jgi:pyruvate-formate lyase